MRGPTLHARLVDARDPERSRCERELHDRGFPLPITERIAGVGPHTGDASWLVAVHDVAGACRYAFAVRAARSRAVPGYLLLRVERLDPAVDPDACAAALGALAEAARRRWPRVLRAHVELFSLDGAARAGAAERLRELGFRRAEHPRMYRHTPIVDLSLDEETLFSRLHRSARRNIRGALKGALELRPITDAALAPRLDALIRESFARTGGHYTPVSWESVIELSRREPDQSRLAGVFRTDADGPESLVAFEWGVMHGDHAQSVAAGSTRSMGRAPLSYPLVWDLMRWARERGARYFDFGGVTGGSYGSGDPLGGISDFKRSFGPEIVEVGDEWVLEPNRIAARLAVAVARGAALLRRAASLLRPAKSASFRSREG